ncbi:uncharacterized protein LOC142317328 isoform X2 [Lycorma delicatula]
MDAPTDGSCINEDPLSFDIKVEIKQEKNSEIECLFIPVNQQMEDLIVFEQAGEISHLVSPEKDPFCSGDSNSSLKAARSEIGSIKLEKVDVKHEELDLGVETFDDPVEKNTDDLTTGKCLACNDSKSYIIHNSEVKQKCNDFCDMSSFNERNLQCMKEKEQDKNQ